MFNLKVFITSPTTAHTKKEKSLLKHPMWTCGIVSEALAELGMINMEGSLQWFAITTKYFDSSDFFTCIFFIICPESFANVLLFYYIVTVLSLTENSVFITERLNWRILQHINNKLKWPGILIPTLYFTTFIPILVGFHGWLLSLRFSRCQKNDLFFLLKVLKEKR